MWSSIDFRLDRGWGGLYDAFMASRKSRRGGGDRGGGSARGSVRGRKGGPTPLDGAVGLAFFTYAVSAIVTPICLVLMAKELAFTLSAGGGLEIMRSILIVVVLLASGFASARWGKERSLGLGGFVVGAGYVLYSVAPGYGSVLAAAALIGMGSGMWEGLLNPLVQELHPVDSGRYLNLIGSLYSGGILITVLVSGELLTRAVSWRLIILGVGFLSILCGILFFVFDRGRKERGWTTGGGAGARKERIPPSGGVLVSVFRSKTDVLKHPRFWIFFPLMFLAGGTEGGLTYWSASYIQLYFGALPRMGGVGTALFAAGMMIGRFSAGWFVRQHRIWHLLLGAAVLGAGVTAAVPFVASQYTFFAVLFLAGLSVASFWPSIQSYSADRIPLDPTALFILLSVGGVPGYGAVAWIMGIVGDRYGLTASFIMVPILFAALAVLLIIERLWKPARN